MNFFNYPNKSIVRIMRYSALSIILLITTFQLCFSYNIAAQEILQRKVNLSMQNETLRNVIKQLNKQTQADFVYSSKSDLRKIYISLKVRDRELGSVLNEILPHNLTYEMVGNKIVIKNKASGQESGNFISGSIEPFNDLINASKDVVVKGQVTDAKGEPLIGVSVKVKGTNAGASTDINGRYSLTLQDGNGILVFSYIGFVMQEVVVNNRQTVNVVLIADAKSLDEVVVVGYGTQRRGTITGAVASVAAEDLENIPVATVGQMLQGRLAGVRVTQTSGRPGQGIKFQIRGAVSLTAGADPLYVVDGMPIDGDLSFLNPEEIENISVLKDPASAALYGSRSANGVILVTTKSGKTDKVQLDFNTYYGVEQVPENRRLKMMNATQYAQFQKEIATANGRPVSPAFANPSQYGEGTDWFKTLTRTGAIQSHNVSLGAGTEKFKTFATVGYFKQEGVVINTGFERISLRINNKYQPTDKLTIGFNIAPTQTFNTNFNTDGGPYGSENIISAGLITTPLANPYNPDGSLALTASDPATFGNPNWLRVVKEKVYNNKDVRLLSNAFVEYKILDGLTAKTTLNVQTDNLNIFQFNPSTIGTLFSPPPRIPFGSNNNRQFYNWVNENTLNYETKIGEDHKLDALVGFTSQKFRLDGTNVSATNYPDDRIQTVNAASQTLVTSDIQKWALLSFLARLNYSYKDKYLFQASFRRDGSSRFGSNNRWGNFPALSAGWVVSQEDFWNVTPISYLKLRASYGITGNFEIGNFTHISTMTNAFYAFGNAPFSGAVPNNLGNPNLGWENNKQVNIGADINLFNNRLEITYNYYNRKTTDLLFNVSVPVSSGFSNLQSNIGELGFWGNEFAANATLIKGGGLTWNSAFNISFDRNKTLALATASGDLPSGANLYGFLSHRSIVGEPVLQFYGAVWDGVYKNQEDFDKSPKNVASQVGTIKFKDINGDGVITFPEDMTLIGNPWPKFTFGMANNFNYGKFDMSFAIAGSYGNKILAFYENWATNLDGVFNVLEEVAYRWKSEANPGKGIYGSVAQGTTFLERDRWSNRYLKDGSYLAFKNIQMGYDIVPKNEKYLTHVFVSLQNAFILTKYRSGNPEVNTRNSPSGATPGFDDNSYPLPRTITLGMNFKLR